MVLYSETSKVYFRDSKRLEDVLKKVIEDYSSDEKLIGIRKMCLEMRTIFQTVSAGKNNYSTKAVIPSLKQDNSLLLMKSSEKLKDPFRFDSKTIHQPESKEVKAKVEEKKSSSKQASAIRASTCSMVAAKKVTEISSVKVVSENSLNLLSFSEIIDRLKVVLQDPRQKKNAAIILKYLRTFEISSSLIKQTEAGKFLTILRKTSNVEEIRTLAKLAVQTWKVKLNKESTAKVATSNVSAKFSKKISSKPTKLQENPKFSRVKNDDGEKSPVAKKRPGVNGKRDPSSRSSAPNHHVKRKRAEDQREREEYSSKAPRSDSKREKQRGRELSDDEWMKNYLRKCRDGYEKVQQEESFSAHVGRKEDEITNAVDLG